MRAMTQLVLEVALDQAALRQAQGQDLTIAVNLSASSLVEAGLPDCLPNSDRHPNGDRDTGHHYHADAASEAKRHSTVEDSGGTSAGRGGT
jgi:hypothetical protein